MRCWYFNNSPVSPPKTALAMLHITCSVNFLWKRNNILADWTSLRCYALCILCWLFRSVVFSDLWVFYNQRWYRCQTVMYPWRESSNHWTWRVPLHPCICCSSEYGSSDRGGCCRCCEKYVRLSKASIWISLCGRYPWNTFSRSFSDFATTYTGVAVGWVNYCV